jgi:GxxExxY protein
MALDKSAEEERIGNAILAAAIRVHSALGPGLLEGIYEACLAHELSLAGFETQKQVPIPVVYDDVELEVGVRLDLLVGQKVIVEVKSVEKLLPIHLAQVMTYLKVSKHALGFLLNFNVVHMKDGIKRAVA